MVFLFQVVHDWILALIVLILVGIVIIILTVFMIVDRDNLVAIHVPDLENNQEVVGVSLVTADKYN